MSRPHPCLLLLHLGGVPVQPQSFCALVTTQASRDFPTVSQEGREFPLGHTPLQ